MVAARVVCKTWATTLNHSPRMSSTLRDAVLLLTHSGDYYTIDLVSQALARQGVRPIRFNTDLFPSTIKISGRVGDAHVCTETGEVVSAAEVRGVWARKIWTPSMAQAGGLAGRAGSSTQGIAAGRGAGVP